MSRLDRFSWFATPQRHPKRSACRPFPLSSSPDARRLRVEELEDRRMLAVFTVSTLNDTGTGSLRAAVALANNAVGHDTILFNAALFGQTITLDGTDIDITEALTIDATPLIENITIDADERSRIFDIGDNLGTSTLAGLTLIGGNVTGNQTPGGAVSSGVSPLIIDSCTISGNSTNGSQSYGGGIFVNSSLTISNSTVSDNSASRGGGISAYGNVTVTNSTISGSHGGYGGGIFSFNDVTLTNSTVSENDGSRGGGINARGDVTLINSTVANNLATFEGGGIWNKLHHVSIIGSIVSGNTEDVRGFPDLYQGSGTTVTVSHSLIGDTTGTSISGGTGNVLNQPALLGPLADNGGSTQTHALLTGSPAIDKGNPAVVFDPAAFDQRGNPFVRVFDGDAIPGARIDMGAHENQPIPDSFFIVDTLVDELDGSIVDGDTSLRDAIAAASSEQTITFSVTGVIDLTLGQLDITKSLTIDGPGASQLTIDAGGNSRIFDIDDGSNFNNRQVLITGLTLTGGNAVGDGGAIRSREDLTISDLVVTGNMASGNGGGLDARSGSNFAGTYATSVIDTVVSNNSSTGNDSEGGGIFVMTTAGTTTTISGSIISDNDTSGSNAEGGGISVLNLGTTIISLSTISGNRSTGASSEGGGIYIDTPNGGTTTIFNSTISGNGTDGSSADGGGIYVTTDSGGMTTITDSTISGNSTNSISSNADGGGIYIKDEGTTRVTASTITGNASRGDGGGIAVSTASGNTTIEHSTVAYNTASPNFFTGRGGGGLFIAAGNLTLDHSIVAANIDNSTTAPEVFGAVGASFSLISDDTGATITDNGGNQIGSGPDELNVSIDMAAMGDFELGGIGRDSYVFEYSLNGGSFLPLFTGVVDEAGSLTYTLEDGSMETLDDPLQINGTTLDNQFQKLLALVPGSAVGDSLELRLTATSDGGFEAFAFRNITVQWGTSSVIGRALGLIPDMNVTFVQDDPDYTQNGDMFGIRSRTNPGTPGLPGTIVDDTVASPPDNRGIIRSTDTEDFFGVVDTVNLTGDDVNVARWTFNIVAGSIDPHLGPLQDNGGPTETHALLAGSPAIDAGDPGIIFDPTQFDQRGAPYGRVEDGDGDMSARIDMGAYEVQSSNVPTCDFDGDGDCDIDDIDALIMEIVAGTNNSLFDLTGDDIVDLADRDQWLADAGALNVTSGNPYLLGDSNLDGVVDGPDFIIWNGNKFTSTGKWSQADWNADGFTDGQDLLIWNGNKFQSSDRPVPLVLPPMFRQPRDLADSGDLRSSDQNPVQPDVQSRPVPTVANRIDAVFASSRQRDEDSEEREEKYSLHIWGNPLPINSWVL